MLKEKKKKKVYIWGSFITFVLLWRCNCFEETLLGEEAGGGKGVP